MTKVKDGVKTDLPHPEGNAPGSAGASTDLAAGKSVAEIFGEIVWLMTQDAELKQLPLSELEWLVMPPILLRQFRVFYAEAQSAPGGTSAPTQGTRPVGAVLYAMASDAVAVALDVDTGRKLRLTVQDWRSGPHKRVVRVIAPFGGGEEMVDIVGEKGAKQVQGKAGDT